MYGLITGMGYRAGLIGLTGAIGLLAGCPTVDLGDTPSDINQCNPPGGRAYFDSMIWPSYVRPTDPAKGCTRAAGCHGEAGGNAPNFKTNPVDLAFNYRQTQVFLNCGTPEASPFLTKPLAGEDPHGGMDIFPDTNDPAVQIFFGWFQP